MGTFQDAVQWMKEGKKVRRPLYNTSKRYFAKSGIFIQLFEANGKSVECIFAQRLEDFEATDWEIYEEESHIDNPNHPDWNWYDDAKDMGKEYDLDTLYEPLQIALKEQVLKDIESRKFYGGCKHCGSDEITKAFHRAMKEILDKRFGKLQK